MSVFLKITAPALVIFLFLLAAAYAQEEGNGPLVLGMSADFTGPNRALGIEYYLGASCYFEQFNAQGGINHRNVSIKTYDDRYEPDPAVKNTIRLVEEDQVFALFNYVGTPTTTRILPLLNYYQDKGIFMFTPLTGASPVASNDLVFNLRASYDEEISEIVEKFIKAGTTKLAVFHQLDAYGRGGWQSVRQALARYGLSIAAEATYVRGMDMADDYTSQVRILKQADPEAVISIASYESAAGFIRDARDMGLDVPVANLSFANAEKVYFLLTELEERTGRDYTFGLVNSQVVPFYGADAPALRDNYIACIKEFDQDLPPGINFSDYFFPGPNAVGFEGFLNAKFVAAVLRNIEGEINRAQVYDVVSSIREDTGGVIHFSDIFFEWGDRKNVFFITLEGQDIVSLEDFSGIMR